MALRGGILLRFPWNWDDGNTNGCDPYVRGGFLIFSLIVGSHKKALEKTFRRGSRCFFFFLGTSEKEKSSNILNIQLIQHPEDFFGEKKICNILKVKLFLKPLLEEKVVSLPLPELLPSLRLWCRAPLRKLPVYPNNAGNSVATKEKYLHISILSWSSWFSQLVTC